MNYYLNLSAATVGQEVAIDPGREYSPYVFAKVVKVTQNQVHVQPEKDGADIARFSKVTARELNPPKFDDRRRLVSKETAESRIAAKQKMNELRTECAEIKHAFSKLAQGGWSVDTAEEVQKLAERMKAHLEKVNEG